MKKNAFTLIEMLIVMSVITTVTTLVLANYRGGAKRNSLRIAIQEIASNFRKAQNMAITAQKFGDDMPYGYGIYFSTASPESYIIFADVNDDELYSGVSEDFEIVILPREIEISSLNPPSPISIVFAVPEAGANISGNINLKIKETATVSSISVTSAGVIEF